MALCRPTSTLLINQSSNLFNKGHPTWIANNLLKATVTIGPNFGQKNSFATKIYQSSNCKLLGDLPEHCLTWAHHPSKLIFQNLQLVRSQSNWSINSTKLTSEDATNRNTKKLLSSQWTKMPVAQTNSYSRPSRRATMIDNPDVDRDTVIYTLKDYGTYFRRTFLSGFGAIICFYGSSFIYTLNAIPLLAEQLNPMPFVLRNRIILAASIGLFGVVSFAANKFFLYRTISQLTIKSGGERVFIKALRRIPLTMSQYSFEVPLKHITCEQSRDMNTPYIRIKIKNKIGSYYIDKNGFFPDPILFDSTIGVMRKI